MVFSSKKSVANGNERARECELRGLEGFVEEDSDLHEVDGTAPGDVSGATDTMLAQDAAARARQGSSAAKQGGASSDPTVTILAQLCAGGF